MPDQKFTYILWQSQTFCAKQKDNLLSVKLVFVPALYAVKFLGWHKRFGLAQNILGPVKGQGFRQNLSNFATSVWKLHNPYCHLPCNLSWHRQSWWVPTTYAYLCTLCLNLNLTLFYLIKEKNIMYRSQGVSNNTQKWLTRSPTYAVLAYIHASGGFLR